MNFDVAKVALEVAVVIIGWAITAAVMWGKLTSRVNGLGNRLKSVEVAGNKREGRLDRMETEVAEYRRDAQDAAKGLARMEKGIDDVHESVNQSTLQLGSQLAELGKSIQDKDTRTQVRLTRIETVAKIEEKIGPIEP